MYISDRYVCLTYWRFQLSKIMRWWKVTKSHMLLAKMNNLHHIYRCLKVHGKTRQLVNRIKESPSWEYVSLANVQRPYLIGLVTQIWGTCLGNFAYVKVTLVTFGMSLRPKNRVTQWGVHIYQAHSNIQPFEYENQKESGLPNGSNFRVQFLDVYCSE
jgi:hypothetical protein